MHGVPHHQPFPAQGLAYSMTKSPLPYGHFLPSPFGCYPHFMLAPPLFETPRTTMLSVAELDDEGDFDGQLSSLQWPTVASVAEIVESSAQRFACQTSSQLNGAILLRWSLCCLLASCPSNQRCFRLSPKAVPTCAGLPVQRPQTTRHFQKNIRLPLQPQQDLPSCEA